MNRAAPQPLPEAPGISKVVLFVFIGILLPAFTLGFEAMTRISSESFFNPVPTVFHGVLIASVPLSNLLMLVALSRSRVAHANKLAWLNAFAIGIACFYAVLYLPLTPFAPFMLIWFGFGLLPLAPMLSLVAAIWARRILIRSVARHHAPRLPRAWIGIVLALAVLAAADTHFSVTRIGMHLAASPAADSRQSGIRLLRAVGDEDLMLRLCYGRSGMSTDLVGMLLGFADPVSPDQARSIFYQVTGTPFNDKPLPKVRNRRDWRSAFDEDRGGARVGAKVEGVTLASSRIDGSLDANATTGYLEWTMVFRNESYMQQEGRGQIALPPGAVVSRVTLWIDGEEREAAFGGRSQVRQAYERVVRQQRDPVLVTTAGKDRILFQLFPIPPQGEMKIRIGMTVPMTVASLAQAKMQLPSFRERNFEIRPAVRHEIWFESKTALDSSGELQAEHPTQNVWALRGVIADDALGRKAGTITARRDPSITTVWAEDRKAEHKQFILQRYTRQQAKVPRHAVLVIDGSLAMTDSRLQIAEALTHLPRNIDVSVVIAGDDPIALSKAGTLDAKSAATAIKDFSFAGGRSNLPALTQAWDIAAAAPDGVIVWIHGPQPIMLDPVDPLLHRFERRPDMIRLIEFEAVAGPNRIAEKLDGVIPVTVTPRLGTVADDLRQLFEQWQPAATQIVVTRERAAADSEAPPSFTKTSDHIVRLWAADQAAAVARTGKPEQRETATLLAQRYQLVTPLTGAVVLETQQQYTDAGLEPVAAGTVPTIPEPETWMLMFLVLSLLTWQYLRHYSQRSPRVAQ